VAVITLSLWGMGTIIDFYTHTHQYNSSKKLPPAHSIRGKVHPFTNTDALYRLYNPQVSRGIALLFHDHGTKRG
jgi:ABC-type antimicrobial peptide transport system permease subunit